jgi:diguanylate cyclase (GGDEF)-like protein
MRTQVQPDNTEEPKQTFNLLRYFSLFSIGIIVVLTVILSVLVYKNQKSVMIAYSISSVKDFAQQLNYRLHEDFIDENFKQYGQLRIDKRSQYYKKLDEIARKYLNSFRDIKKFKIYDRSGTVIYSTNPEDVGLVNQSKKLKDALMGGIATALTERVTPLQDDTIEKGKEFQFDVLEVYVPIYDNADNSANGKIIGVFETYNNVSFLFNLMRTEFYKVPLLLIFAMSILYLFLHMVIKKANSIINKQNEEIVAYNCELEETQKRIKKAIETVIENESFHVRFHGNNLVKCWETKDCLQTGCPSYKSENLRCWEVSGTFCGGKPQGYFAQKYGDCRQCEVYQNAYRDRINMIGESFNNMMVLLESKHLQLEKLNQKLNVLIDTDHLTGVGNRRSFQKRMESIHLLSLRYNHPYSIIICDVDNFKLYNDTYGHQKGDYALVSIANVMKASIRRTDEIFRWGGEEFIIILPEQNLYSALRVAENLRVTVESLAIAHSGSGSGSLTISAGVTCNIAENVKYIAWENIIKQADDELYKAKAAGKNRISPAVNIKNIPDEKI